MTEQSGAQRLCATCLACRNGDSRRSNRGRWVRLGQGIVPGMASMPLRLPLIWSGLRGRLLRGRRIGPQGEVDAVAGVFVDRALEVDLA